VNARRPQPLSLHEVFAAADIHRPADLVHRVGLRRQYAHAIWTGAQPLSRQMARRIAQATGLPYAMLMGAEVLARQPVPKGRPPKPKPRPTPARPRQA
jgi:hypothetical protein